MQKYFEKFIENITLTSKQKKDAKTKYNGVCKTIHKGFYDTDYDGSTKLLFGSYKKKTAIRPMDSGQDVDVLFKINEDIFNQYKDNKKGQSALLQKIRDLLISSKYSLGEKPKAWGKVILVTTSDGCHNVEILPAFEKDDRSFVIPNTENGGSWDNFNPRREIENFNISNEKTGGLTRCLIKIVKRWNKKCITLNLKSYIIDGHVIDFLSEYSFSDYPKLVLNFFDYLNVREYSNFTVQAKNRAKKAIDFLDKGKKDDAVHEYRKIFGDSFPIAVKKACDVDYGVAPREQFIEESFIIDIDPNISFDLIGKIGEKDLKGFRRYLNQMSFLPKNRLIVFEVVNLRGIRPYECMFRWKVRNFGEEAEKKNQLRGEILEDGIAHKESSLYEGRHFVECYIIKNNRCVSIKRLNVPIK